MKNKLILALSVLPLFSIAQQGNKLWYKHPAKVWTEALPIGNGRLGAMVFGRVDQELIQLNEGTLWSGGPVKHNVNPNAFAYLQQTRDALLKEENYTKAAGLARKLQGVYSETFEPLGDVMIEQHFKDKEPSAYYRDLDIHDAVTTTRFTIDGTEFTRQVIASAPDQVIVMHFTANITGQLNFKVSTKSLLKYTNEEVSDNEIAMKGRAPYHSDPNYVRYNKQPIIYQDSLTGKQGMRYVLLVKALGNGTITSDTSGISVKNGSDVTLFFSAATSFNGYDRSPDKEGKDEVKLAKQYLDAAVLKDWSALLAAHTVDFHQLYDRVKFELAAPADNSNAALPTNERLIGYTNGAKDPGLETLYYNFGRYLLISCSRPGGAAANLQGIWNDKIRPSWSSNYTTNINTQMNYWPAEMTNLSE